MIRAVFTYRILSVKLAQKVSLPVKKKGFMFTGLAVATVVLQALQTAHTTPSNPRVA